MPADAESHDDVAGLFKRLGRRDDTRQYHDFSGAPTPPATAVVDAVPQESPDPVTPPPVPAVAAPVAAAGQAEAGTLDTVPAAPPVQAARASSLQALFQRLLEAPLRASAQSPLARLRAR
jgi:hypothetical protein